MIGRPPRSTLVRFSAASDVYKRQDFVRFVGDQVAVVVAETAAQAAAALPLIKIDYEDLPLVTDPLQAMRPDSPDVHPERPGNIVHLSLIHI